ncbi:MAG: V-type ATPase subunit, partial [Oscillospiraceae bacterium]|nr:V-type ATPase subunit [Oscillospiraceae bacterium]
STGSDFITGYVKTLIDSANIRTAVRCIRTGKTAAFLSEAVIGGGTVSMGRVCKSMTSETVKRSFSGSIFDGAAKLVHGAVEAGAMSEFELKCDAAVGGYLSKASLISFGPEAVLTYLSKLENEITAIRMILTGKLSGIDPEVLRERLRAINV